MQLTLLMTKNVQNHSCKIFCFYFLCFLSGVFITINGFAQDTIQRISTRKWTKSDSLALSPEKYPVLYGEQSRDNLIQSLSYLNGKELERLPTPILSSAFSGQLAGLYTAQTSGAPRFDGADVNLRGRNPLLLIDGIPRSILSLNPEQVESVTVLKDALSTAMLGMRGMNGAILITTRKSSQTKQPQLSLTAQTGVQSPLGLRKGLSSYDYATLYNEALINDGRQSLYTQADLDAYKNGTDPFGHPDVDWYNLLLKKTAPYSRYTFTASASYNAVSYFVSLDYLNQQGLFRESPNNTYATNATNKRYTFRSNINIKINDKVSAFLNILGSIQDAAQPGSTTGTIFTNLLNTPNNAYPALNFNGTYGGNQSYGNNLLAQLQGTGYLKNNLQNGFVDIGLKRDLSSLLPGLWGKAMLSYNPSYEQQINRTKQFGTFQYPTTGDTANYQRFGLATEQTNTSSVIARSQQTYSEASLGYNHQKDRHRVDALLLLNYDSYQTANQLSETYKGIAARASYHYNNKYGVEMAAAYNGNNSFVKGSQYGFFPAAGISWNLQNETFFKEHIHFLNLFKLRATYGKVGSANPGYYVFQQNYVGATGYVFGTTATSRAGIQQGDLANGTRTWEKAAKLNIGADLGFSRNRGWLSVDYYRNRQYDLLQQRGSNTALLGQSYPDENIGINKYYGVEMSSGWKDKIRSLSYYITGNFSTRSGRIIYSDEVAQPYTWLQRTSGPINQMRGLVANGFFTTNLTGPTTEGYKPVPGDIKYKDLNGDGVINHLDETVIGNKAPLLFFGASLGVQFKGFDATLLLQGVENRDILLTGNDQWEFQNGGKGQVYVQHLTRWTPQTAATATYPRLTIGTNINNHRTSSFWVRSGDFIRLKNAEIGYSVTNKLLSRIKLQSLRLFFNGLNLYTISSFKESDPETYDGGYPLQRVLNGGITIKF